MKKTLVLLLLLALCLPAAWAQGYLKVMSYNVRQSYGQDGPNSWCFRKEASARMLQLERPTLLGLQETCPEQVTFFDSIMVGYDRLGVGRDDGKLDGEMMSIYYDRALFELVDWGTFWLSATPDQVSQGWDGACKRTCTWAVLTLRTSGQRVLFLNTHLDHIGKVARREGVRLIAERIKSLTERFAIAGQNMPTFLTADFNTSSVNPIFDILKEQMREARATAPVADTGYTFNEWGKVKQQLEANGQDPHNIRLGATGNSDNEPVIDHIFYRAATPLTFRVLRDNYGAPYISDHYPVVLEANIYKQRPVSILAIGNSFSEDAIEQYLWEIAHEKDIDLTIGNLYHGGCSLERHANNLRTDSADYAYRKVISGYRHERPATTASHALHDEHWDFVTMQQASHLSGQPKTYEPFLTELLDSVGNNTTAQLAWHTTWAYSADSQHGAFKNYGNDQQKMYAAILKAVEKMLKRHHFDYVIPAGTAIQNARATDLGDTLCRDGYHLNLLYGRYCVALTWAEVLLGIDATSVTWCPEGVTPEQAALVRTAAHEAALSVGKK